MERWPQRHRVDHDLATAGELQPDDLEQVARSIRSDRQDARRVGIRFEIDNNDGMVDRVQDCVVIHAVLARRSMYLHTHLS